MSIIARAPAGAPAISPRFSAWWLAIGLVGTSATAWRLPDLPLGFGELVLLGWLVVEWGRRAIGGANPLRASYWRNCPIDALALLATLAALAVAQVWAILAGELEWSAQRDFVAIVFAAGLALTLSTMKDRESFSEALLTAFFWIAAGLSSLLLVYGLTSLLMGLRPWVYSGTYGTRFMGFAINPNQLALFCLTLPACLGLAWMHNGGAARHWAAVLGWIALMVGVATQTDALALAWGIVVTSALVSHAYLRFGKREIQRPVLVVVLSICLAFLGWWQIAQSVVIGSTTLANLIEEERWGNPAQRTQVRTRLKLYANGLRAWMDSPWVGHGVQMVSGLKGPYEGKESHNTPIDWLTFAGVLGTLPLLAWSVMLFGQCWRRQNFLGLGVLIAVAVYAQFGLYARHPLFWVVVCAFAYLPGQPAEPSDLRERERATLGDDSMTGGLRDDRNT